MEQKGSESSTNCRECVKTRITAGPDGEINHEDTKAQEDSLKRTAKCLSFSVFVSFWFSLLPFLIDRTSFYTVSVAGGTDLTTLEFRSLSLVQLQVHRQRG